MQKAMVFALFLLLILFLSFALGAALLGQKNTSTTYSSKIETLYLETTAKMHLIKTIFWGGLAVVALLGAAGVVAGVVRTVWLRSQLIPPHDTGLFPVAQGRAGGQIYYHDPNRQLAGSVIYSNGPEGVTVRQVMPPNDRGEQLQVASQAQATQLVAAAGRGQGLTAQNQMLLERLASNAASRPVPRLPQITVLDKNIAKERHLLTALRADWEE